MAKRMPNVRRGEAGHGGPFPAILGAAIGAVLLSVGAAMDTGWLTITGGVVLAVGLVATNILNHMLIEYGIFGRLEKLEGKK